jgi:uncharacterized protein (TIRG00374 family)
MGGSTLRRRCAGLVRRRASQTALAWAGLLVSIAFSYLAVRHVRLAEVWHALRSSNESWLAPGLAAFAFAVCLKAVRWRFLFGRETRPGVRAVLDAMLIGYFFNSVLPARAGEAARVLALQRRAGTSPAEAAATVVIERAVDVLSLLLILFATVPWLPHVSWLRAAVLLAIGLTAALAGAIGILAAFGLDSVRYVLRPVQRLPWLGRERVDRLCESLGQGLAALRRPRLMLGALVWTTLSWLALALSIWFVMHGFGLGLSPAAAVLVLVATNLVQIVPSSPSAIGVFETGAIVALRAYGVGDSRALSFALVLHALNVVPFLAAGLVLLRPGGGSRGAPAGLRAGPAGVEPQ